MRHDRTNEERYREAARWYLARGERAKTLFLFQNAMQVYPKGAGEDISFLDENGFTMEEIRAILPERAPAYIAFARHLKDLQEDDAAANAYRQALRYVQNEERVEAAPFAEAGRYFLQADRPDEAAHVLQQGVNLLPSHAGLRQQLAAVYLLLGLHERAVAEYRMVLTLEPGNEKIRALLQNIEGR